jgi:hypothetical protein
VSKIKRIVQILFSQFESPLPAKQMQVRSFTIIPASGRVSKLEERVIRYVVRTARHRSG